MNSISLSLFAAAWMLVLGYGLVYIGWKGLGGTKVSFQDAFGLTGKGPVKTGGS